MNLVLRKPPRSRRGRSGKFHDNLACVLEKNRAHPHGKGRETEARGIAPFCAGKDELTGVLKGRGWGHLTGQMGLSVCQARLEESRAVKTGRREGEKAGE